jgi:hypothetical protein
MTQLGSCPTWKEIRSLIIKAEDGLLESLAVEQKLEKGVAASIDNTCIRIGLWFAAIDPLKLDETLFEEGLARVLELLQYGDAMHLHRDLERWTCLLVALFKAPQKGPSLLRRLRPLFVAESREAWPKPIELQRAQQLMKELSLESTTFYKVVDNALAFAMRDWDPRVVEDPIGLDKFSDPVIANCGSKVPHRFERQSLEASINQMGKQCPICRGALNAKTPYRDDNQLRSLYDQRNRLMKG